MKPTRETTLPRASINVLDRLADAFNGVLASVKPLRPGQQGAQTRRALMPVVMTRRLPDELMENIWPYLLAPGAASAPELARHWHNLERVDKDFARRIEAAKTSPEHRHTAVRIERYKKNPRMSESAALLEQALFGLGPQDQVTFSQEIKTLRQLRLPIGAFDSALLDQILSLLATMPQLTHLDFEIRIATSAPALPQFFALEKFLRKAAQAGLFQSRQHLSITCRDANFDLWENVMLSTIALENIAMRTLTLEHIKMDLSSLRLMISHLEHSKIDTVTLTYASVCENDPSAATSLLIRLASAGAPRPLKHLDFSGNSLESADLFALAICLERTPLETLVLDHAKLDDRHLTALLSAFANTAKVVNLSLKHNLFTEEGKAALRTGAAAAARAIELSF